MSLINVSSAQPEPILLSGPASPIEITLKDLQNSISNETKAREPFSQIPAPQPLFKDLPSEKSTDLEEDPELIIYDSVKKPTIDTKPATLSRPESGNSGYELQGKEMDKSSQSPSWKPANTNMHSLKAGFDEKMSFQKSDENSLTCGSNLINVSKREIINLEDDEDEPIDTGKAQTSKISSQSVDSLIVNDPCMNGLAQSQEQLLKQLILKNMMNQAGLAMQRQQQQQPPPLNPAQKAFMAAAQLLQMNQMAQRGFINPFGNMPFLGGNPAMMPQFSANYNSFNPMMNQGTYPNMFNRFQDNSLLGKRAEPQDGFGQQNERQVLKVNKLENNKRTEVIVLEDEESEEKGYRNTAVLWQAIQLRKKIFTVEKTSRKQMYKRPDTNKKQVFTIIRQKNQKNRFIRNKTVRQTKYLIHTQSKMKIVQKKETAVKLKVDQDEIELGKRKSIKLRREDVFSEGSEEYEDAKLDMLIENSVFSEETPIYDDYVINLHVDENEDNEDIIDTPIGREFQIKLLPFHGNPKAKRSVKCVWNPETEDQELIKSCFELLESKFDRKIVSEEGALKMLKKFDMDVDKVAEELEANSMAFKSLFTIRQKVLRSRIFNR